MLKTFAIIDRIVDGDTFWAWTEFDVPELGIKERKCLDYRPADFDAPETYRPYNEAMKLHGEKATQLAETLAPKDSKIYVQIDELGKYRREVGEIWLDESLTKGFVTTMKAAGMEKLPTATYDDWQKQLDAGTSFDDIWANYLKTLPT